MWKIVVVIVIVGVATICLGVVGCLVRFNDRVTYSGATIAVYPGGDFEGYTNFSRLTAHLRGNETSSFYVEVNGEAYRLDQLPEEVAATMFSQRFDQGGGEGFTYTDNRSYVSYVDGQVRTLTFYGTLDNVKIGAHEQGPFFALKNLDRETLIATFGEPIEWRRARNVKGFLMP